MMLSIVPNMAFAGTRDLLCAYTWNDLYSTYVGLVDKTTKVLNHTNESGFWGQMTEKHRAALKALCNYGADPIAIISHLRKACDDACGPVIDSYFKPKKTDREPYVNECKMVCLVHNGRLLEADKFATEVEKDLNDCRRSLQSLQGLKSSDIKSAPARAP